MSALRDLDQHQFCGCVGVCKGTSQSSCTFRPVRGCERWAYWSQAAFAWLCACAGDKPEQLYPEARQELRALGYESTLEYAADAAGTVMRETGLLPHINAGTMGLAEVSALS